MPDFNNPFQPVPRSLDDADLTAHDFDIKYPLGLRYPDWRQLLNTTTWVEPLGDVVDLEMEMCGADREQLLGYLLTNVAVLHDQAVQDEIVTLSKTLTWAYWSLDVPLVGHLHPLVWVESMPLVRWLRANIGGNALD